MSRSIRSTLTKRFYPSNRVALWVAVVLLLACAGARGTAQTGTTPPGQTSADQKPADDKLGEQATDNKDIPRIRVCTNEATVVFTVTDKHGKRVTDLKQADFRFVDDNKPAAEIRSFRAEANWPLQVGLLIAASTWGRDRFRFYPEPEMPFRNS